MMNKSRGKKLSFGMKWTSYRINRGLEGEEMTEQELQEIRECWSAYNPTGQISKLLISDVGKLLDEVERLRVDYQDEFLKNDNLSYENERLRKALNQIIGQIYCRDADGLEPDTDEIVDIASWGLREGHYQDDEALEESE